MAVVRFQNLQGSKEVKKGKLGTLLGVFYFMLRLIFSSVSFGMFILIFFLYQIKYTFIH